MTDPSQTQRQEDVTANRSAEADDRAEAATPNSPDAPATGAEDQVSSPHDDQPATDQLPPGPDSSDSAATDAATGATSTPHSDAATGDSASNDTSPGDPTPRDSAPAPTDATDSPDAPLGPLAVRGAFGGLLMGLANLVPGISGGTMLLASGVYQAFVDAIADLTRLRFRPRSLAILGAIAAMAAVSILLFAGPVKTLVVEQRWVMYSLFIGLTLGGVPVLWKLIGKASAPVWIGACLGLLTMLVIAWFQMRGAGDASQGDISWPMFLIGGALGASAMVLPGVSGGYLLLLLGQYVPILGAIDAFKDALLKGDIASAMTPAIHILIPVAIGVLLGIVAVSNLLKLLFARFERPTLGVLLGFLVGAVFGLWPFQQGARPAPGFWFKGRQLFTPEEIDAIRENWPTEYFTPSVVQIALAVAIALAGFALTVVIGRFGDKSDSDKTDKTCPTVEAEP